MTIPFPEVDRVIYKNNPIVELICEFRFPRILSINEKAPVEFQEKIRSSYPIYKVAIGHQGQVTIEMPANSVDAPTTRLSQSEKIKNYQFYSADRNWRINLTSTSFSVSTQKYERWEEFLPKIDELLKVFEDTYKPAFYERIGLKYVDAFQKSKLNFDNTVNWGELIEPQAVGYFAEHKLTPFIKNYVSTVEIDIGDGALAQIQTFLAETNNVKKDKSVRQPETVFIIASDLFYFRKELEDTKTALEYLHSVAYRLLRSIITKKLHDAMRPEEI